MNGSNNANNNSLSQFLEDITGIPVTAIMSAAMDAIDEKGRHENHASSVTNDRHKMTNENANTTSKPKSDDDDIDLNSIMNAAMNCDGHSCIVVQQPDGTTRAIPIPDGGISLDDIIDMMRNNCQDCDGCNACCADEHKDDNAENDATCETDNASNDTASDNQDETTDDTESIGISRILVNNGVTVMQFSDRTKTIAKCDEHDTFNPVAALSITLLKKIIGNQGFHDYIEANLPEMLAQMKKPSATSTKSAKKADKKANAKTSAEKEKPATDTAQKKRGRKPAKATTDEKKTTAKKTTAKKSAAKKTATKTEAKKSEKT